MNLLREWKAALIAGWRHGRIEGKNFERWMRFANRNGIPLWRAALAPWRIAQFRRRLNR